MGNAICAVLISLLILASVDARRLQQNAKTSTQGPAAKVNICHSMLLKGVVSYVQASIAESGWAAHAAHENDCHMEPTRSLPGTLCPSDRMNANCTCTNGRFGGLCSCSPGQTLNAATQRCEDIENIVACTRFPCSNTTGAVSCTNILAPAGGRINPQGRACACQDATRFYANDIDGCVDVDACAGFPCRQNGAAVANCTDRPNAANSTLGRTCSCAAGYSYSDATGCVDVDACKPFPCSTNGGPVSCADIPAAAGGGNNTQGRTCSCQDAATQFYANETAGCVDVDACIAFPCQQSLAAPALCTDLANAPNTTAGRTCSCGDGYAYADREGGGCSDVEACKLFPCSTNGGPVTCADIPAALGGGDNIQGRTCSCDNTATQFYANETAGCVDIDACIAFPCQQSLAAPALCTDLANAPNTTAGRTCSCGNGYAYADGEGGGCYDVEACQLFPCSTNGGPVTCGDISAALGGGNNSQGRTCTCDNTATQFYANETAGCVDVDACIAFPCQQSSAASAQCTDLANAPNTTAGRTCSCGNGYGYADGEGGGCFDVEACQLFPCSTNGGPVTCGDIPAALGGGDNAQGRTCTCNNPATQFYANETAGCVDVDACIAFPCQQSLAVPALCTDLANAPNTTAGRTCSCGDGYAYADGEGGGCSDVEACKLFPCSTNGGPVTCADIPAPLGGGNNAQGRTCTCDPANQFYANETAGCVDIDACIAFPCQQSIAAPALCTDLANAPNTTAGRTCSCGNGYAYADGEGGGCYDVEACKLFPCSTNGGAVTCGDIPAAFGGGDNTQGRTCTCDDTVAQFYANETAGCVDVDACIAFPCQQSLAAPALCTDLANAPNTTAGRTCACDDGYAYADGEGGGCSDVDACKPFPCNTNGGPVTCADIPAALGGGENIQGRTCSCGSAATQFYANETAGCVDIDACIVFPCQQSLAAPALCTDLANAPNTTAGRTCSCGNGYAYADGEGGGCSDVEACQLFPCSTSGGPVTCGDISAALGGGNNAQGRTCTCEDPAIQFYANETAGCVDIDACIAFPCQQSLAAPALCSDLANAPNTTAGRTCSCGDGYAYADGEGGGCSDVEACQLFPCSTNGGPVTCGDIPAALGGGNNAQGRMCMCDNPATQFYANETAGCVDIDACIAFPCQQRITAPAQCTDLANAPNTTAGRTCSCGDGYAYADGDGGGCSVCLAGRGGAQCSLCSQGFWSAGGPSSTTTCTACGTNFTTPGEGATSASNCSVCLPGRGGAQCSLCSQGFWSAGGPSSTTTCTSCGTANTTSGVGATSASNCTVCLPGRGGAQCNVCSLGFWSAGGPSSTTTCTQCSTVGPTLFTTSGLGATSASNCSVPVACASVPTIPLSGGSWPATCAGRPIGGSCSAACSLCGLATVTCLTSGVWGSLTGACTVAPFEPTSASWSTTYTAWPSVSCTQAPCRFSSAVGVLAGYGNGAVCTSSYAGSAWTSTTAEYLVPSTTSRYTWRAASGSLPSGAVYAGRQIDGNDLWVCRMRDRFNVMRVGKAIIGACFVWDGVEFGRGPPNFDFLVFA